jgi:hypothetical protein
LFYSWPWNIYETGILNQSGVKALGDVTFRQFLKNVSSKARLTGGLHKA